MVVSSAVTHQVQGSAENVVSERRALASQRTNGGKSNLPHALSVSSISMQDRHQYVQAQERVRGNKMSIIAEHGAPEPRISDDSLPGTQHLSRTRVQRKALTGTSAMG
jgi:hypothetical protein